MPGLEECGQRSAGSIAVGALRHRRLQRLVDPWLDGETTTLDAREVEAHIAGCRTCLGLVELTVLLKDALARRRGDCR